MRKQAKAIWLFFGLGALLVVIGTVAWLNGGGEAGGSAVRRGGAMDLVFQIAYPVMLILFAGIAIYLLVRRRRD